MSFSERLGFVPQKEIQIDSIDSSLLNRIRNYFDDVCKEATSIKYEMIEYVLDKLGEKTEDNAYKNENKLKHLLASKEWYVVYDILEYTMQYIIDTPFLHSRFRNSHYFTRLNNILIEEKSGYRMVEGKFVKITNESELDSINKTIHSDFDSVNTHMKKALSLYSNRKNPDYENSIKESISTVEAMCCIITGMKGSNATLGAAIKKLEDNGVVIHGAMKSAFSQLYGYTSDQDGIRHGGIDFKNAPEEDALYMLISCSAFVNYLIEKYSKIQNGGT